MKFSFCESVTSIGPWHIRQLSEIGPMYGGGADTLTLCRRDLHKGWDLKVPVDERQLRGSQHVCPKCKEEYERMK